MNTHDIDIDLPQPFTTVYDDVDKVEVRCYSESQVRAAIEADHKRRGEPYAQLIVADEDEAWPQLVYL